LIQQSIRRFEKEHLSAQFYPLIGTIISGIVRYQERGNTVIDFGKVEGTLYRSRSVWSDKFAPNDSIACLLQNIEETSRGPELVLTRLGVDFVKQLMAREIPEIKEGIIHIQSIVRAPGYRTKLVVSTDHKNVDPVGSCIGKHGSRIKGVLKDLGMEKIDVLRFCEDFEASVMEVVRPTVPKSLVIDRDDAGKPCAVHFALEEKDFAIFVGKNGLNLKLASELLGCPIHVERLQPVVLSFEDKKVQAMQHLMQWITSVPDATVARLVTMGITDLEAFHGVSENDLIEAGIDPEEAHAILQDVQAKQHGALETQ
jgi:N utilization substance protein A